MIKLNIASGNNVFPSHGWINYDHEDFSAFVDWVKKQTNSKHVTYLQNIIDFAQSGGNIDVIRHTIDGGFPQHLDNTVDLIYCGQAIEHFNPIFLAPKFVKECYRMLKPGGVLRMTTPDLDLLINAYLSGEMNKFAVEQPSFYKDFDPSGQLAMLMYGSCGDNCTQSHYEGHMFLYTKKSMTKLLKEAGFEKIQFFYEPGKSYHPVMSAEVVDMGMTHSFIVEGMK